LFVVLKISNPVASKFVFFLLPNFWLKSACIHKPRSYFRSDQAGTAAQGAKICWGIGEEGEKYFFVNFDVK